MNVNEIPRGQLSTIILSSLLDGDKYGYEIIDSIEKRTNGEIVVKKPSLYSTLTRLEKQDLVSSYWKDSDIGGKRHYYRLTDFGKKQVIQWQEQLYSSQNKLAQILQENQNKEQITIFETPILNNSALNEEPKSKIEAIKSEVINEKIKKEEASKSIAENNENNEIFLKQESLFNIVNNQKQSNLKKETLPKTQDTQENHDYIQYDLFSNNSFIAEPESFFNETTPFNTQQIESEQDDKANITPASNEEKSNSQSEKLNESVQNEKDEKLDKSILFKQSINELLKKETAGFEERLQNAKKSFNFESEYKKHLKSTKSYAETFDTNKDGLNSFSSSNEFVTQRDLINHNNQISAKSFIQADHTIYELEDTSSLKKLHNQFEEILPTNNFFENTNKEESNSQIDYNLDSEDDLFVSSNSFNLAKNKSQEFSFESIDELEQKTEINDSLNINEKTTNSFEKPEEKTNAIETNDSLIITDRLEFAPKVQKIAPASFSHLNKNQIPAKRLHTQQEDTNFEQMQVLNELPKQNNASKIDSTTPAKNYFNALGIKVSEFNKNSTPPTKIKQTFKTSGKKDYVNVKKFKFFTSSATFLLLVLQILTLLLVLGANSIDFSSSLWLIIATISTCGVWVLYSTIMHLKDKSNKVLKNKLLITPLWQKIILMAVFLILVYSVHLIAGMDLYNVANFAVTLALPVLICFDMLIYHFVQIFVLKK